LSGVIVEFYGGAAGRVGPAETAYAQRPAGYNIGVTAQGVDATERETHTAWGRGLWEALKPQSSGRHFLNFLDDENPDAIRGAFGANYKRLAELKRKYDPTNFFSLNQNIEPAR